MSHTVVAVVPDLMFLVQIQTAVKQAGMELVAAKNSEDALKEARTGPVAIILDLNTAAIALIETLKNSPDTRKIPLFAFVPHVETELRNAAVEKGCDMVVARSAFAQSLPKFLSSLTDELTSNKRRNGNPG